MEREKVLRILKRYRDINKEIELNRCFMKDIEENYYMPKKAEAEQDGTEKTALNIPIEISEELKGLQRQISEIITFKEEVKRELESLETIQCYIIFWYYIKGKQWFNIASSVNYSVRQCKNIRSEALRELGKRFDKNKKINCDRQSSGKMEQGL